MKLNYRNVKSRLWDSREPSKSFVRNLKAVDHKLDVVFNRVSGRWEIYRLSNGTYHWILEVANDDGSYRPLDTRTINKLYEMDVVARYGSVEAFERHLDDMQKKWRDSEDRRDEHELKWQIKDDRKLWQRAVENARSGKV